MNVYYLLIIIYYFVHSFIVCDQSCSRENSRIVRDYFIEAIYPIYEKNHLSIPYECIFSPNRDIFYQQELNKAKISNTQWLCKYCNKTFYSEYHLDKHLSNRHNDTLIQNEQSVCLADYCLIFRCDVLKQTKKSIRSVNPLARGPDIVIRKSKQFINEQQLTILRSRCASVINECVPHNIHHDNRVNIQHEMYAEVCAYLTTNRYLELPNYFKSLISFTTILSAAIFIFLCLIGIGILRRADWKFNDEEDESEKHLSDETISTATALLSKTPASGIIHSSKSPPSTIRHRVRFKSLD
ncbi:unnamed protein product [Adineta steineri]|uniref:C2H2-type domain-containing protein n=1 Tax=Adineta steineri TaxID=433720 RepID=A0A815SGN8_9BILA|nr:unnamed protein product [Adineta steineri]CAF3773880.1 unnamed protein product [Adineta steineri]